MKLMKVHFWHSYCVSKAQILSLNMQKMPPKNKKAKWCRVKNQRKISKVPTTTTGFPTFEHAVPDEEYAVSRVSIGVQTVHEI